MDYAKESLRLHKEWGGKIEVICKVPCKTKDDLSLAYTPGVAQPCLEIQKDISKSYELTRRHNNANTLCLGGRVVGPGLACQIVDAFLDHEFEGGRHQKRIDKMMALETL
mgnify:CR=1 FL=1